MAAPDAITKTWAIQGEMASQSEIFSHDCGGISHEVLTDNSDMSIASEVRTKVVDGETLSLGISEMKRDPISCVID